MMFDLIAIVLIGALLVVAAYTAFQFLGRFPKRTIDDVTPFLRPAEAAEFEALLDPVQEVNVRFLLSSSDFIAWQRKRFHLVREYLLRMSHNALVLIEWGNMEAAELETCDSEASRERLLLAQELVKAATEFRIYSVIALVTLKFWLLLPASLASVVSPSLPRLRNLFGINAVGAYARLKNAAGSLSLAYSNSFQQDLLAKL